MVRLLVSNSYLMFFIAFAYVHVICSMINGGRINVVNIDGELKRYSEMVFKGEQPFSKWDDLVYVGTAAQKEIQDDILTEQEMMQFAVYMREKKEKSSLH
ncbi:hypothetical protein CN587_17875 [Bacillus wiedmannii]|nr:hypothetical protein CN587_17875 [Bacillus wiedmannii]